MRIDRYHLFLFTDYQVLALAVGITGIAYAENQWKRMQNRGIIQQVPNMRDYISPYSGPWSERVDVTES